MGNSQRLRSFTTLPWRINPGVVIVPARPKVRNADQLEIYSSKVQAIKEIAADMATVFSAINPPIKNVLEVSKLGMSGQSMMISHLF